MRESDAFNSRARLRTAGAATPYDNLEVENHPEQQWIHHDELRSELKETDHIKS